MLTTVVERVQAAFAEAVAIWISGGWAMWAIALVATVMFGMGVHILLQLRAKGHRSVREAEWRGWIDRPQDRRGAIGRLLDAVGDGRVLADEDVAAAFQQARAAESAPIERDLKVMKVCVSAAPLVGLLGTVMGMLTTFGALASGGGGEKTMAMIATGISEALITTETGLVVALPGLFFQYSLRRKCEQYLAFLAHVETVCTQVMHRRARQQREALLRRYAAARVARVLQRAAQQSAPTW